MPFPIVSRYTVCAAVSLLAIMFSFVYAQGAAGLWKIGEAGLTLGFIGLAVAALVFLERRATANRDKINQFIDDHANAIAVGGFAFISGVVLLGWYAAATATIGKRTEPVVSFDQAGLFLITSSIAGFCLAGFMVRGFPAKEKFVNRMMFGIMATAIISLLVFTIASTGVA